jgi:transposase InsO family protein
VDPETVAHHHRSRPRGEHISPSDRAGFRLPRNRHQHPVVRGHHYIHTWEGWLYLATVTDLDSRRVAGWATADHLRTDLIEQALRNAVTTRRPAAGVIFHSDRGCQYTSAQFVDAATELGVRLSIGRTGQCWDNALAESFFATIKGELLEHRSWPTHTAARAAIFDYIEGWYNTRRRHSALGYLSPAAYENTAATHAA